MPREVAAIIARCLRKKPAERYRSAGELLADARKLTAIVSRPGVSSSVSEAASEYVEAEVGEAKSKNMPLMIGAVAGIIVLALIAVVAVVIYTASTDGATDNSNIAATNTTSANSTANLTRGIKASPSPIAVSASERVVEITVSDGKADVYRGAEKVGTTPYAVQGKLGEQVALTLRREGYADEPVSFVVGEKKAFMYTLKKN